MDGEEARSSHRSRRRARGSEPRLSFAAMSDDPIRELLAAIPPQPFWAPKGQTVILRDAVIEAGGDPDAVEAWVEARGGRLDRTVPVGLRSVLSRQVVPDVQYFYLVPDEALAARGAAA